MPDHDFLRGLRDLMGPSGLLDSAEARLAHGTDWRRLVCESALGVALPASTAEVQVLVARCAAAGVAILPQGGNTGLVAGAVPVPRAACARPQLIVNLRRMNRIREINPMDAVLTLEAGVILAEARAAARAEGLELAISLASEGSCQIGGNIATNAGGVHVVAHGMTREQVLGLEVVLPDGSLHAGLSHLRKNNTGPDLKQLFIGSEGIFGLITAASLRLQPLPRDHVTALIAVEGPAGAIEVFRRFRAGFGAALSAFEYVTDTGLQLALAHGAAARSPFAAPTPAFVLAELSQTGDLPLQDAAGTLVADLFDAGHVQDCVLAQNARQRAELWALREMVSEGELVAGGAIKHDVAVPISAIPQAIERIAAALAPWPQVRLNVFGHIGDGNLHVNLMPGPETTLAALKAREETLSGLIYDAVAALGGTFSAEHGIGQLRAPVLAARGRPGDLALMAQIKALLDPQNLFNPGKVLP